MPVILASAVWHKKNGIRTQNVTRGRTAIMEGKRGVNCVSAGQRVTTVGGAEDSHARDGGTVSLNGLMVRWMGCAFLQLFPRIKSVT